jgi:hypothetical protein
VRFELPQHTRHDLRLAPPYPKAWEQEARIAIQQIEGANDGCKETDDDWPAATFWRERSPSAPLPPMPGEKSRAADLWQDAAKKLQ